ncbi:MAG: FecR domain-containing protein [Comamonadaceae bacterium]|nr:FecR domain-containing protein [Comamonadaceae bacterium]
MRAATASVDYVQGSAHVSRSGAAAPLTPGAPLHEGNRIQLDPDAFVSVRLADGSLVRVQANSQVQLNQLRRRGRAGSLQSVLEVQQGAVEVQVPGRPNPQRRLDVLTPVAATSVRGTVFDVQLAADGSVTSSVLQGRVAVQSLTDAQRRQPATALGKHTGLAVSATGQAGVPTPLLPAPAAHELPQLNEDAQWLNLPLPAWEQARSWRVSVSQDVQGQHVLRNGQFQGTLARFAAIPDGNYFLHARALDHQGISGSPATVPLRVKAHPVAPLVQTPAPGAVLAQGEAELRCTPVAGVSRYHHQVIAILEGQTTTPASAFAQAAVQPQESTTACSVDLRQLPAGHYAWRAASVRLVQGAADQGPFAAAHAFRIAPRPATLALEDVQVQTSAGVATIHWPAEPGQRFRLQAFAQASGTEAALDTVLNEPRWTASELPPGTWHVRIQVQDPSGLHSAFSPPRSVQVLALLRDSAGHPVVSGAGLGWEHP